MGDEAKIGRWLGYSLYLIFLLAFNLYIGSSQGLIFVAVVWAVFKAIEYFFSGSKLSLIVKTVTVLAILFRTGVYGAFFNPMWVYNVAMQVNLEIQHFFMGNFDRVLVAPLVINLLIFIVFKEVVFEKRLKHWFLYIVLFVGGSLLLFVNIWKGAGNEPLMALYLAIGLIKIFFANMERSSLMPKTKGFPLVMALSIFLATLLIWNVSVPVTLAHELEAIKIRLQGGYTPVESGEGAEEGRSARISGYSSNNNDNLLGGAVELSNRPTLIVETTTPIYLRGETRYLYTGRGWSGDIISRETVPMNNIPITKYPGVTYEELNIKVDVLNRMYQVIFSGLNTQEVRTSRGTSLTLANGNDLLLNFNLRSGDSYELVVLNPIYTQEVLRQPGDYSSDFPLDLYTGLPENFPDSIKDLSLQLTNSHDNNYDKAVAIRNYLTSREFRYNLDVGYPREGVDFVEHFLQEKEGYCVHYSTAFVVMARSVGIPARWVKGFTQGSQTSPGIYTIADRNSHAWAEIYLPNAGWVTFEATPGFQATQGSGGQIADPGDPAQDLDPQDDPDNPNPSNPIEEPGRGTENQPNEKVSSNSNTKYLMGLLIVVGLISIPIFSKKSKKILTPQEKVIRLYNKVTRKLQFLGIGKQTGETPREYLQRISHLQKIPSSSLTSLTNSFEYVYYGENSIDDQEVDRLKEKQNKYPYFWLTYNKVKNLLKK